MATEVGDAYIDVHGDLTPFRKDLSKIQASAKAAARKAADSFAEGYEKRVGSELTGQWDSILDAFHSGKKLDWDKVVGKFDSENLDDAAKQIKEVINGMRAAKKIGDKTGLTYRDLADAVDGYVTAAKKQEEIDEAHAEALKMVTSANTKAEISQAKYNKTLNALVRKGSVRKLDKGIQSLADALVDMDFSRIAKGFKTFEELEDHIGSVTGALRERGRMSEQNQQQVDAALKEWIAGEQERLRMLAETKEATRKAKEEAKELSKSFEGLKGAAKLKRHENLLQGITEAVDKMDWSKVAKGFKTFDEMDNAVLDTMNAMKKLGRVGEEGISEIVKSMDKYIDKEQERTAAIRKTKVKLAEQKEAADLAAKSFDRMRENAAMAELTRDARELAAAMETLDFSRVVRGFKSWADAKSHIQGVVDKLRDMGRVSDEQFGKINNMLGDVSANTKKFGVELARTTRKFRPIHFAMKKIQKSWDRMDSTVRVVTGLIAAAAGPIATLGSGLAGAATALASSLAMAAGSAVPLAAAMTGVGVAVALAVKSMESMKESFPGIEAGAKRLGEVWTAQAERFGQEWGASVASLLNRLQQQIGRFDFGTPLGKAMSEITNAFEEVIGGPEFTALLKHLRQTLPSAFADLGTGAAHLSNGLVSMLAAASPVARTLANDFERWAGGINHAITNARKSGELTRIFERMRESLLAVLDFAGSLGQALGTLFSIGATTGNQMLNSLTRIVDKFTAWMQTDAGRQTMLTWFQRAREIMAAIAPVAVGLAKALGGLVTEHSIAQFQNLMATIGQFLPMLGDMLSTVSQLGILNILAELLRTVGAAIQPLLPAFDKLFSVVGPMLQGAIRALAPLFKAVAAAVAPLIAGLARLWTEVAPVLVPAIQRIVAALRPIIAVIGKVVGAIMNVLVPVLGPLITGVINNVVGLIEGISDVVMGVVGVITNIFQNDWPAVWKNMKQIVSGAVKAVWNFIQLWLVGKVVALVKLGLTKILGFFTRNWTKIVSKVKGWITNIANFIRGGLDKARGWAKGILDKIRGFFSNTWSRITSTVRKWIDNIRDKIQSGLNKARSITSKVLNKIRSFFSNIWSKITSSVQKAVSNVRAKIQAGMAKARAIVERILGIMKRVYGNIWNNIVSTVRNKINGVKNSIQSGMNRARSIVTNILGRIKGFFSSAWNTVKSTVGGAMGRIASAVRSGISKVVGFVRSLPGKAASALSGIGGRLVSAGQNLISGFIQGIRNMAGNILDAALDAVGNAVSAVKNFLGIKSPSRLFMTFGEYTGEGMAIGMERMRPVVESAATKLAEASTTAFDKSKMRIVGEDAAKGLAEGLRSKGAIDIGRIGTPNLSRISQMGTVRHRSVATNDGTGVSRGEGGTVIESGAIQLVTKSKDPKHSAGILLDELSQHTKMG